MAKKKDIYTDLKENDMEIVFLIEQYQALSERRISQNELFWSVPLMFLTAQSFLLILAFGGFTDLWWAQAAGAFISFFFLGSFQSRFLKEIELWRLPMPSN